MVYTPLQVFRSIGYLAEFTIVTECDFDVSFPKDPGQFVCIPFMCGRVVFVLSSLCCLGLGKDHFTFLMT
jgi:hypothetical protein